MAFACCVPVRSRGMSIPAFLKFIQEEMLFCCCWYNFCSIVLAQIAFVGILLNYVVLCESTIEVCCVSFIFYSPYLTPMVYITFLGQFKIQACVVY